MTHSNQQYRFHVYTNDDTVAFGAGYSVVYATSTKEAREVFEALNPGSEITGITCEGERPESKDIVDALAAERDD